MTLTSDLQFHEPNQIFVPNFSTAYRDGDSRTTECCVIALKFKCLIKTLTQITPSCVLKIHNCPTNMALIHVFISLLGPPDDLSRAEVMESDSICSFSCKCLVEDHVCGHSSSHCTYSIYTINTFTE